jgi:type IV secretion system protein VirD4
MNTLGDLSLISSRFNKGFVIGTNARLTRNDSFTNLLICGPTGSGKSSALLLPTLFSLKNCSMIINDPSGELYQKASGYLSQHFYIQVLNFSDSTASVGYNPLARMKTESDINKLSDLLIRSTVEKGSTGDPFWSLQGRLFLSLCIKLVFAKGKQYHNLANVLHVVSTFTRDDTQITRWVEESGNEALRNEFLSFASMPDKTKLNIVATVRAALEMFSDPEIARVTSIDSVDFDGIRSQNIVIFIQNSIAHQKYLNTLIGVFFDQLYSSIFHKLPSEKEKDLYIILEEASSIYVNVLPIALSNARKHRVGSIICTQDHNQLQTLYGNDASTIISQCLTKVYLPGHTSLDLLRELEILSGESGITMSGIRELSKNSTLILSSNVRMIKGSTTPYYSSWKYRSRSSLPAIWLTKRYFSAPISLIPFTSIDSQQTYASA